MMRSVVAWSSTSTSVVVSMVFFSFTLVFSMFSLLVFISRMKPWCRCQVCRWYLSGSWASRFPNLSDWYTHLLSQSRTGTVTLHVLSTTVTANPVNVEHILRAKFHNYPKGKPFSTLLGDLLGQGIFNADGHPWRFQRKMASLELGSVSIRSYASEIVNREIQNRLIPFLSSLSSSSSSSPIDLQDIFQRFSFDTICNFSFGMDPSCLLPSLPHSTLASAFDLASTLSALRATSPSPLLWKLKRLLHLGSERRLRHAIRLIDNVARDIIRARRNDNHLSRHDLLSRFMGSVDDETYLRDIVVSFLLAGRDTVSAGLTGFFLLLSKNPHAESAIREELDRVMDPGQDMPTFEQMKQMHYLNAAVHEAMRLFPPVQFDSKYAEDDDVLPDGTFVKKGTRVTYHPYAMGRMERIWGSDCLQFRPERWLNKEGLFVSDCPFKYPVFQAGVRICLGKDLALMEMKSVVAAIVRRFDIRVVGGDFQPRFVPGLTASFRGGLPVQVSETRRDPENGACELLPKKEIN